MNIFIKQFMKLNVYHNCIVKPATATERGLGTEWCIYDRNSINYRFQFTIQPFRFWHLDISNKNFQPMARLNSPQESHYNVHY